MGNLDDGPMRLVKKRGIRPISRMHWGVQIWLSERLGDDGKSFTEDVQGIWGEYQMNRIILTYTVGDDGIE